VNIRHLIIIAPIHSVFNSESVVMPELNIPLAVDENKVLYSPVTSEKSRNYFCPACGDPVILKQGKVRIAHFAHKVSNSCNQETIIHKTAKLLIQKVVHKWKLGKSSYPIIQGECQICEAITNQPLPDKVESAVLEHKLADGSIADVALLVEGMVQAAVEIRVTHAVGEMKTKRLSIPFIELDGNEVIENPEAWRPITDNFKPLTCDKCKTAYSLFQAKVMKIAKDNNVDLPTSYYRFGFTRCWKCKREIIVFAWQGSETSNDFVPELKPIPRTVQFFSKADGWVNTCPLCESVQGDYFLYDIPTGPFFTYNRYITHSPEDFMRDLMIIAQHIIYSKSF
jgi:hypothetical protein